MTENSITAIAQHAADNPQETTMQYEADGTGAANEETINNGSENHSETIDETFFEVDTRFLLPALIGWIGAAWAKLWGEGEGAALTDDEKNGFESLFERGFEHWGLKASVTGTKGFIMELTARMIGAFGSRFMDEDMRQEFKRNIMGEGAIEGEFSEVTEGGNYASQYEQSEPATSERQQVASGSIPQAEFPA